MREVRQSWLVSPGSVSQSPFRKHRLGMVEIGGEGVGVTPTAAGAEKRSSQPLLFFTMWTTSLWGEPGTSRFMGSESPRPQATEIDHI